MVGSSPRYLTYMQLLATPVGAAAVAWMYPLLREQYGVGKGGLSAPISRKWAGFAEILAGGISALPTSALVALVVASLLGILLAVLEMTVKDKTWVPSPTGIGIGMLVPFAVIVTMVIGGLVALVWTKKSPKSSAFYVIPLASGLIAGEALVAVIVPLLVLTGRLKG
ncbi:MAG: OPT/YSL family transporter [Planctomycetes bacterium]|nr:OPT/YSL family transporter [Planctomycetota bacterium]